MKKQPNYAITQNTTVFIEEDVSQKLSKENNGNDKNADLGWSQKR